MPYELNTNTEYILNAINQPSKIITANNSIKIPKPCQKVI